MQLLDERQFFSSPSITTFYRSLEFKQGSVAKLRLPSVGEPASTSGSGISEGNFSESLWLRQDFVSKLCLVIDLKEIVLRYPELKLSLQPRTLSLCLKTRAVFIWGSTNPWKLGGHFQQVLRQSSQIFSALPLPSTHISGQKYVSIDSLADFHRKIFSCQHYYLWSSSFRSTPISNYRFN